MNAKKMLAQLKRELWENRIGFIWAPLVLSGLLFVVAMWVVLENITIHGENNIPVSASSPGAMVLMTLIYQVASSAVYLISFAIVIAVYAHSSLFVDRKSREILFWRSMPVSETVNVLTKLAMILILMPFIVFLGALIGGLLFALFLVVLNPALHEFGAALRELYVSVELLMSSFIVIMLLLPLIAWSLFCSAFARRSPVTISLAVPLGLWIVDSIAQRYLEINLLFKDALRAYAQLTSATAKKMMADSQTSLFDIDLLSRADIPVVSVALLFSAVMIGVTIWLRNNRYEI